MKLFKPKMTTVQKVAVSNSVQQKLKYIKPKVEKEFYKPISLSSVPQHKLRIGYFSTWQIACGIAVYTEHLYNALKYNGNEVFAYPNTMSVHELIKAIDIDRIHILNLQYEPAIMPLAEDLAFLINELHYRKIKVMFTMHSESSQINRFANIVDGFIYHKPSDYLKERVHIIPMGVPVFEEPTDKFLMREKYGFSSDDKIITTTGFMFTWKQHASILNKLVPYLKEDKNLKVQLLTTFNKVNPDECKIECKNIKEVIESNNLGEQIIHITEFLPQNELSERLWLCNLGYLWSGITTTSSSAAGKDFITSRLPLVATNSSHYHDLMEGVIKTEMDQDLFVDMIIKSLYDDYELSKLSDNMRRQYQNLNNNKIIQMHLDAFLK